MGKTRVGGKNGGKSGVEAGLKAASKGWARIVLNGVSSNVRGGVRVTGRNSCACKPPFHAGCSYASWNAEKERASNSTGEQRLAKLEAQLRKDGVGFVEDFESEFVCIVRWGGYLVDEVFDREVVGKNVVVEVDAEWEGVV